MVVRIFTDNPDSLLWKHSKTARLLLRNYLLIQRSALFKGFANEIHKQAFSRYQIIVLERHYTFNTFIHRTRHFIHNNEEQSKIIRFDQVYCRCLGLIVVYGDTDNGRDIDISRVSIKNNSVQIFLKFIDFSNSPNQKSSRI